MKNIYLSKSILILCIGILFMFSSCSITKCRYSNGFNISFGGKNNESSSIKRVKKQPKKTEICLTNQTDTNLIETSVIPSENNTVLYGENKETEAISTLSKKSIAPKILKKITIKPLASKIKNTKGALSQKSSKNQYSIIDILRLLIDVFLFILCFLALFSFIFYLIIALLYTGFFGFGPILIILSIALIIATFVVITIRLMQLFGLIRKPGI
jgi:hypothetical protein